MLAKVSVVAFPATQYWFTVWVVRAGPDDVVAAALAALLITIVGVAVFAVQDAHGSSADNPSPAKAYNPAAIASAAEPN